MSLALPIAYARHPLGGDVYRDVMPAGLSIAEIAARIPGLPRDFHEIGIVCIDGEPVERFASWNGITIDQWGRIIPKPRADGVIRVTFHLTLHGRGVRSALAIVAAIALVAVTTAISAGALGPAGLGIAGGFFAAGSTSATLLAAAVGILGRFALTALAAPAAKEKQNSAAQLGNAGADGNALEPGGAIPRVCGTMKIFPPLAALPLVDLAGDDEIIEAAYVLAGPHQMIDPRAENGRFDDIENMQYVIDDGVSATPSRLLNRYGRQRTVQFELKAHERDLEVEYRLRRQDNPDLSRPEWRTETTGLDPDEIWLHLVWPQGMGKQAGNIKVAMPFRLRMRPLGTTDWINLPELWFHHKKVGSIRKAIRIKWGAAPAADDPVEYGAWHSFHSVPDATVGVMFGKGGWTADASFDGGAAIYDTARVERAYDGFTLWLDDAVFPRGVAWEVQIKRGCLMKIADFFLSTYGWKVVSQITPMFDYYYAGTGGSYAMVPTTDFYDETILETCTLTRFASVWNSPPLPLAGNARIELRGRNIQAQRVSVMASGLIPLWDGSEWSGLGVSGNPADHYRHVLADAIARDPAEPDVIDEASILAFRTHCTTMNYKIAAAFDGRSWRDTLSAIAGCGKGQRKEGSRFGVVWERDRSAETAVQSLSPRQVNNLALVKAFENPPQAFRVTFRNALKDYEPDERLVLRPGIAAESVTDIVPVDAVGVVDAAQIDQLFALDLSLVEARDYIIECDVHVQALVSERGDMVELNHLVLSRHHAAARIRGVTRDGSGDVTGVTIDAIKPLTAAGDIEDAAAVEAIADIGDLGQAMGCVIRTGSNLSFTAELTNGAGRSSTLTFATPVVSADIKPGDPVFIGPVERVSERMLIQDIRPSRRFNARLTLIPEAPEAFS